MYKTFTRTCCAAMMLLAAASSHAASDDNGNFMYVQMSQYIDTPPIVSNADKPYIQKIYETEPGSNIYEGIVDTTLEIEMPGVSGLTPLGFAFYYELAEDAIGGDAFRMNIIHSPENDWNFNNTYKTSGVYYCDKIEKSAYVPMNYCWLVPNNFYRVRLDLNENKLWAVPKGTILALINDDTVPSLENIGEYSAADDILKYYPAGDLKIYLYDLYNEKWLNPVNSGELGLGASIKFDFQPSDTKDRPFTISNWNGGVLDFTCDRSNSGSSVNINLAINKDTSFDNINDDVMYVEFANASLTPWKGCSDQFLEYIPKLYRQEDGTYKGTVTVPDESFRLRVISELTDMDTPNKVLAPSTGRDRELSFEGIEAYSTAKELNADKAGYWTSVRDFKYDTTNGGWKKCDVEITVTLGDTPSVKFETALSESGIYLKGDFNGWGSTCQFKLTPSGGFYTSAYMYAGQVFKIADDYWAYINLGANQDIDMSSGSCTWTSKNGEDNIHLTNWAGGMLYIYIKQQTGNRGCWDITVSTTPITGVTTGLKTTDTFIAYADNDYSNGYVFADKGYGIYTATINRSAARAALKELRLFSKCLPLSPEEKAWEGSYALRPVSSAPAAYDELGVAEFEYIHQDYVTEDGCDPFKFDDDTTEPGLYDYQITIDTNKNKIYVERVGSEYHYVLGDISDNKYPTFETRADFKHYRVLRKGTIIDVPAGKLGFSSYQSISDALLYPNYPDMEVELNDGLAYATDMNGTDWISRHVVVKDWSGGKVFLNTWQLLDMSTVSELTRYDGCNLAQTAPCSLIYKGTVHCSNYADLGVALKKYIVTYPWGEQEREIAITSDAFTVGTGSYYHYNKGHNILTPKDNKIEGKLGFDGDYFNIPSWIGEGDIDVSFDLNNMTLTGIISDGNVGSTYEAVSGSNSGLDGVIAYPSKVQDDAVVLSASVSDDGEGDSGFNFVTPEGGVITPASGNDVVVEFDSAGVWTGDFNRSNRTNNRHAARARAVQDAKWHINAPEGTALDILIDEANNKITIVSSAHCNGYFIIPCNEWGAPAIDLCVENVSELRQNMLLPVIGEVWEGNYQLDESSDSDIQYLAFYGNLQGSETLYTLLSEEYRTFDLSESNETSQPAMCYSSTTPWGVKAEGDKVHIRYDSKNSLLTFSKGNSGVDEIVTDLNNSNAPIEYYNLQGLRIANPDKGIYIRRQGTTISKVIIK